VHIIVSKVRRKALFNNIKVFMKINLIKVLWQVTRSISIFLPKNPKQGLLLFPSDLKNIVGALGDDAMLTSTIDAYLSKYSDGNIYIVCRSEAVSVVKGMGYHPIVIESYALHRFVFWAFGVIRSIQPRYVACLGADVMDGYYGYAHPVMTIVFSDLASKSGASVVVLGGSFNANPLGMLRYFYNNLSSKVSVYMRDDISLTRFLKFSKFKAQLVADSAFNLKKSVAPSEVASWIYAEKNKGNSILGFNIHPMLVKNIDGATLDLLIQQSEIALEQFADKNVSVLFMPHDYRGKDGDATCLEPLERRCRAKLSCYYLGGVHSAATLKAIAAELDAVVTGRMHLAIAALGCGVPVLSVTYQDKFEGLYRHFKLSEEWLVTPESLMKGSSFNTKLVSFVDEADALRDHIGRELKSVLDLSKKNYSFFKK